MDLPSATAVTMELKLSSDKTMSLASLATSVPEMPMAMPMSASLRAGASLTPSPVMAVISPSALSNLTMSCLCLGSARETQSAGAVARISSCLSLGSAMKSLPVKLNAFSSSSSSSCNSFFLPSFTSRFAPSRDCFCCFVCGGKTPMERQTASAVFLLSPVMTMTRMPANLHSAMAAATSGRGGSWRPANPRKVRSLSTAA
mmetsp:Transcript_20502/g.36777  ORF Transcript_20502/g.36777 Transcript_20502/m.36777 type:complete len:201 (-) Transcript_20502:2202-2804(-)